MNKNNKKPAVIFLVIKDKKNKFTFKKILE